MKKKKDFLTSLKNIGQSLLGILCILVVWYLACKYTTLGKVMAGPIEAFSTMFRYFVEPIGKSTLWGHIWASLKRVLAGYCFAAVSGIILGLAMGYSPMVNAIAKPIFNLIKPIPAVAWIPLIILWFGIGETAKIIIIFLGGFSHMVVNSNNGVKVIDPMVIGAARVLGANNRQVFFTIIIPATVPYIFAGLQIALSTCWMSVLAAEMVSSREGVGWLIITGMNNANTAQIISGMIPIGVVGMILVVIMSKLEKYLCSWTEHGK